MAARKFNRDARVPGVSVPASGRKRAAAGKGGPKSGVSTLRPDTLSERAGKASAASLAKTPPGPIPPLSKGQIVREIQALQDSLRAAYGTATAVHLALRHGLEDADEEVGICLGRHVVEELWRIGEQYDLMLVELGGKPRFLPIQSAV